MKITDIAISDFPPSLMVFSTHGLFYGMYLPANTARYHQVALGSSWK
jgi:hypothetical protein